MHLSLVLVVGVRMRVIVPRLVLLVRVAVMFVAVAGVLQEADSPGGRQPQQECGRKLHAIVIVKLQLGQQIAR